MNHEKCVGRKKSDFQAQTLKILLIEKIGDEQLYKIL